MIELLQLILHILALLFKSRARLEAEILVLRQQLNVLRRQVSKRPKLNNVYMRVMGSIELLSREGEIARGPRWSCGVCAIIPLS
jgi:hypothetical protein